ncbi:MAG: sigma 54-interacting transcriptional regulator [Bacillota bacterium]
MEVARIIMVSPLPELSRLAHQISQELNLEMEIVDAFLDKGVELGKQFEQSGADVIISRGPTGVLLKKALSIPVVLIQITSFDVIQALFQARQLGRKIAYFDHARRKEVYDFAAIAEILSLPDLQLYFYEDEGELVEKIRLARANGVEVIVASGSCVVRMAREHGMEGVMVYSSREALIEAFQRAKDVVLIRQKDREKTEFLKIIIDHAYNGVIAVNRDNVVTHFNPAAAEAFNLPGSAVVGLKTEEISLPLLRNLFQERVDQRGEVQTVGGQQVVFNRIPIYIDGEFSGTVVTFQSVNKIQNLEASIRKKLHASGLVSRYTFGDLVGDSAEIKECIARARKYAASHSTVLITGESGTGKELFAHSIHAESPRREGPFVAINCAAIPKELLESELFGYEEGAFTGAKKGGKSGLFELAHGGTIFLDEISELSLALQSNLLRVLQERVVRRIGGARIIPVDVRIIAATNRLLAEEVKRGRFREDLFYRLHVLNLHIPPLRQRKSDILPLLTHFLYKYCGRESMLEEFPRSIARYLCEHDWPGNVRELENYVEKYAILAEGTADRFRLMEELVDELSNFREESQGNGDAHGDSLTINVGTLEGMERQIIGELYRQNRADKKELARRLGISRTTLWKKIKEFEGGDTD